jgi:hemerythrin-like domain-containing protein
MTENAMNRTDIEANKHGRRQVLGHVVSIAGIAIAGCAATTAAGASRVKNEGDDAEAEVTPGEDLMQEHGVIERVLLIYEEASRRIERAESVDLGVVTSTAAIVRRFVEDYHERNEEQFVFTRLEAAKHEVPLVTTLRQQHQRGREVTDHILQLTASGASAQLAQVLREFSRMYRPHAAREDTVLFPAFRSVIGRSAYRELGEQFEEQEHARFGERGFENTVAEIARLETTLGIDDLAKFTAP